MASSASAKVAVSKASSDQKQFEQASDTKFEASQTRRLFRQLQRIIISEMHILVLPKNMCLYLA